jgi:hypothetical protein
MRPRLATLLVGLLVVAACSSASAQTITIIYNGTVLEADPSPVEQSGRVLVGMRDIFEAMNAGIQWNSATRTVTATQGSTVVVLTIGSNVAYVTGRAVTLDVPAQIIGTSTYVPLRFVAEATGADVQWQGATRTVVITTAAGPGMPPIGAGTGAVPSPVVTYPKANQTVGPSVDVKGRSIAGATIRIVTFVHKKATDERVSSVPGIIHDVWADGSFSFRIALPSGKTLRPQDLYYDIHVWAVKGGEQSEPTVVRVVRQ